MSVPRLRVCLVAPIPPPYGGISNWTDLVRSHLRERPDVQLSIVNTAPKWRAIDDLEKWKRVLIGSILVVIQFADLIMSILRGTDLVHITTSGQLAALRDTLFLATIRCFSIRGVYHIRFGRIPQLAKGNSWEWRLLSIAVRQAQDVIVLDKGTRDTLQSRFPTKRVMIIPNGVSARPGPTPTTDRKTKTALYLGWVIPTKGIEDLVDAWTRHSRSSWQCIIAGPGSDEYRNDLIRRYRPDGLHFLPEQSHKNALVLIADSDLLILPSHTEGFPNVVLEAMSLGKPVLATAVGAIPDILAGGCGVVVPPHDPMALAESLQLLCSNGLLRAECGMSGLRKVQREYSMDQVMIQLLTLWEESRVCQRTR